MQTNREFESLTKVHEVTQFELTKDILLRLHQFDLTPTGKLVLLYLSSCFNPNNGSVVFPRIQTISETLGIGTTACKQAISDLIKQGVIIKTKQSQKAGNNNKYLLTAKITGNNVKKRPLNSTKNELLNSRIPTVSMKEQRKEQKTTTKENQQKTVYNVDELKIIQSYVENRTDISNKKAYYQKIINCDCTFILKKYKQEKMVKVRADKEIQRTKEYLNEIRENKKNVSTEIPESFKKLREKLVKK